MLTSMFTKHINNIIINNVTVTTESSIATVYSLGSMPGVLFISIKKGYANNEWQTKGWVFTWEFKEWVLKTNNEKHWKTTLTFNHFVLYLVVKVHRQHCQVGSNIINGCICLDERERHVEQKPVTAWWVYLTKLHVQVMNQSNNNNSTKFKFNCFCHFQSKDRIKCNDS